MGSCCGTPDNEDTVTDNYVEKPARAAGYYQPGFTPRPYNLSVEGLPRIEKSPVLSHALYSASDVANAVVHIELLDPADIEEKIRHAKAQMKTITVRKNCLYIDYELVGKIPPGTIVRAY